MLIQLDIDNLMFVKLTVKLHNTQSNLNLNFRHPFEDNFCEDCRSMSFGLYIFALQVLIRFKITIFTVSVIAAIFLHTFLRFY